MLHHTLSDLESRSARRYLHPAPPVGTFFCSSVVVAKCNTLSKVCISLLVIVNIKHFVQA